MNLLVATSGGMQIGIIVVYLVVIVGIVYFMSVRPQRNRQKQVDAMLSTLAVGDSILTTSGFYGVVIDISDEVVIVEFGSDRHCRIPMQKEAIVSVEKGSDEN